MKFKIPKKFALYGVLFALTGMFAGGVGADGYDSDSLPRRSVFCK